MANILTLSRVGLIPFLMIALAAGARDAAILIFLAAGLSDFLDGVAARNGGRMTRFGEIMDPVADKMLTAAAILMLVYTRDIAGLDLAAAFLILARETFISGLRDYMGRVQLPLAVAPLAKVKTAAQFAALFLLIAQERLAQFIPDAELVARIGLWAAAGLTVWTGARYALAARRAASPK